MVRPAMNPDRYCAYNETRHRLVATNVEAADGTSGGAEARLLTLGPEGGTTLWISPFRGISPACARFPLDLVFLDPDRIVLDTVEFFPMNVGGDASTHAASVLVLAADTLAQVEIHAGDRLEFSPSDKMMEHLQAADTGRRVQAPPVGRDPVREEPAKMRQVAPRAPVETDPDKSSVGPEAPATEQALPVLSDRRSGGTEQVQMGFPGWVEAAALPQQQNGGVLPKTVDEAPALADPRADLRAAEGSGAADAAAQAPAETPKRRKAQVAPRPRARRASDRVASDVQPGRRSRSTSRPVAPGRDAADPVAPSKTAPGRTAPGEAAPAWAAPNWPLHASIVEPHIQPEGFGTPQNRERRETAPIAAEPPVPDEPEAPPTPKREPWKKEEAPTNWFRRLLWNEKPDPRSSSREPLPNLVAYFFTGGIPTPHSVRDISASGLYLQTRERWYKGTVVQMTLSDRRRATNDRSIALYAKAVRLGGDGVGFQFILDGEARGQKKAIEAYAPTNGIDAAMVGRFIEHYKATSKEVG